MGVITTLKMIRSYSELSKLKTFKERYEYLRLEDGHVGKDTFGYDRYLNQQFYKTSEWKRLRDQLIFRDNGCDLGIEGHEIHGRIIVHHLNPITKNDILNFNECLMNPENLICTTHNTHNAIHYGDSSLLITDPIERSKNDMCPWKH